MDDRQMTDRWRLILGRFAEEELPPLSDRNIEIDDSLNFLYDREYKEANGMRDELSDRRGGRGCSVLAVPQWMGNVRRLFPKKTVEIMQKQALDRYQMTELLTDPKVLSQMEPNFDLLKNLLTFRAIIPQRVRRLADEIIEKAVRELQKKMEQQVKQVFYGRRLPHSATSYRIRRNFDFKKTIEKNLKNYSPEQRALVVDRLYFNRNIRRYNPWNVIILIDESGSMLNSVIYSAVMAAIFAGLPFVRIHLVVFDTALVDLSGYADDPVEVLLKVQLGGGTNIHQALEYAKTLITAPQKTIVVLVSDLYDGVSYQKMYRSGREIVEGGSRLFVLPALDYAAVGQYDKTAAKAFAKLGADVAAITPEELAEWIGNIIS